MTIAPDQVARVVNAPSVPLAARLVPFRPQVQRHILAIVRDYAQAEELTQDMYARALERSSQLRDPQAALAWPKLLGCSLATAKIRVHRARTRLREPLAAACRFEVDDRGLLVCDPPPERQTAEGS